MHRIVFFGSSHHCLVTIEALYASQDYQIVAVVTQPPKPVGRKHVTTPTAVELWAREHNIEVIEPSSWKKDSSESERQRLKALGADVGVLSYYGKILPQGVIDIFPKGIINIHPSLLPKYRGPAPAVGVILNGDRVSGTSIMLLRAEMDAGPILGVVEFTVAADEVPETYYEKGFRLGTEKLLEVLPVYLSGTLQPTEQDHRSATYTRMLKREDGKIDWSKSADEIERTVRAYSPWPGTWTEVGVEGKRLLFSAEMSNRLHVSYSNDFKSVAKKRMKILTAKVEGDILRLRTIHLEGEQPRAFSL